MRKWLSLALKSMGLSGEVARVEIDPSIGGTFFFSDIRNGAEFCHWGTYLKVDYPRRLAFTWNTVVSGETDTCTVDLLIEPVGSGCVATIVNDIDEKWADDVEQTKTGWRCMLQAEDGLLKL